MLARKTIGLALGALVAPLAFIGSFVRGARIFHPGGVVYRAEVLPLAEGGALGRLAGEAAGVAMARLSGGIWRWRASERWPDVLGVALSFRSEGDLSPPRTAGAQDLLFITTRSLWSLPIAPFTTNIADFLANQYYAILPFTLEGAGKVELRLSPASSAPPGENRRQRLSRAVEQGQAMLRLEARLGGRGEAWQPVAAIHLQEQLPFDQNALRFDPGSTALGLVPRGVLQWMRPAVYAASQAGRRLAQRLR